MSKNIMISEHKDVIRFNAEIRYANHLSNRGSEKELVEFCLNENYIIPKKYEELFANFVSESVQEFNNVVEVENFMEAKSVETQDPKVTSTMEELKNKLKTTLSDLSVNIKAASANKDKEKVAKLKEVEAKIAKIKKEVANSDGFSFSMLVKYLWEALKACIALAVILLGAFAVAVLVTGVTSLAALSAVLVGKVTVAWGAQAAIPMAMAHLSLATTTISGALLALPIVVKFALAGIAVLMLFSNMANRFAKVNAQNELSENDKKAMVSEINGKIEEVKKITKEKIPTKISA